MRGLLFRRMLRAALAWALVSGILFESGAAPTPVEDGEPKIILERRGDVLLIGHDGLSLSVSLKCPDLLIDGKTYGLGVEPASVTGNIRQGGLEAAYPPIPCGGPARLEVKLHLQWSARESVLRKWATFHVEGGTPLLLKEAVLEKIAMAGRKVDLLGAKPTSFPAFMEGFFAGIEFPMAATRIEGDQLILAHAPGLMIAPGKEYETRRAVYGVAEKGQTRRAFLRYINLNRPSPKGLHISYNSWWSTAVPYTEKDILGLMQIFEDKLVKPYGAPFDSFCIDLGWSNPKSMWEIDKDAVSRTIHAHPARHRTGRRASGPVDFSQQ